MERLEKDIRKDFIDPWLKDFDIWPYVKQEVNITGAGIADYVIYMNNVPKCVIEAKRNTFTDNDRFQALRYAYALKTPLIILMNATDMQLSSLNNSIKCAFSKVVATNYHNLLSLGLYIKNRLS